ncbi:IS3 family transposase [Anaerosalibacter massiliensis]|uniref:IS3 family transposase n=1 Tax=Anaerosalibacter massiliensis TaxID=1347392 RepID=A0A9X2MFG4_9FIRM|nr:IS3 family transposase [Anaerosalibacter massiliensis]MCR2043040.1 IS3 family transposase [Anaerosalibacter massiliensis]
MCKVLKVSRSSYYKHLNKKESKRSIENKFLEEQILNIYKANECRYGAPKIYEKLKTKGIFISLKRTQRLMSKFGIKSIVCKKFRPFSSRNKVESRQNIINRDFSTTGINQKWVTDITYIHTIKDGWCYLASVMDLNSRKIVGYSMSKNIDTTLAIKALENAYKLQKPNEGLILRSDLGSQYTSYEFGEYIKGLKISHSFSGKGNPYDNACIESFHSVLKRKKLI